MAEFGEVWTRVSNSRWVSGGEWSVLERGIECTFIDLVMPRVLTRMIWSYVWHVIRVGMAVEHIRPLNHPGLAGPYVARIVQELDNARLVVTPVVNHHPGGMLTIDLTVSADRELLSFPGEKIPRHPPTHALEPAVDVFDPAGVGPTRVANMERWKGNWNCGYVLSRIDDSVVIRWFDACKQADRTEAFSVTSSRLVPWGTHTFYAL